MKSSVEPPSARGINMAVEQKNVGMVLRIERSSIHDGDGFRTVVFLKGCPLRCAWCSTPESQSALIERTENNTYGEFMGVEQLMKEIRKDSIFYFHSGGGLTLSGGEPLAQADFAAELLKQAHSEGINTAMETSMFASPAQVEKVLPHLDTLYADLKHIDPEAHERYCGVDIAGILDNIRRAGERTDGLKFIVRIPLIPGLNDDPETLHNMGRFCAELTNLRSVQLLPYHRLGMDTYRKMGIEYPLASTRPPTDQHMENCRGIVRGYVKSVC